MARRKCFAHSPGNRLMRGYFESQGRHRTCFPAVFTVYDGDKERECSGKIKLSAIHSQQRGLDVSWRFFACARGGKVHLCTCPPISKKKWEEHKRRGKAILDEIFGEPVEPTNEQDEKDQDGPEARA